MALTFGTSTALTLTLASLASGGPKVVNHSAMVNNSSVKAKRIRVFVKAKLSAGTFGGDNKIYIYGLRSDGTLTSDGVAATAATGVTLKNADLLGTLTVPITTSSTAYTLQNWFIFENPGPYWAIGIANATGSALTSTAGDHGVQYIEETE